jgi:hypothetical protein
MPEKSLSSRLPVTESMTVEPAWVSLALQYIDGQVFARIAFRETREP